MKSIACWCRRGAAPRASGIRPRWGSRNPPDCCASRFTGLRGTNWLLNYPNFQGARRKFSAAEWSYDQRQYLKWWYRHLPHKPGRYTDGKLNNWWCYIVDLNGYPDSR